MEKDLKKYEKYLIDWMKNYVKEPKAKGLIFGISGGIDSAVVGALAKKAFPNNHLGIIMPIEKMVDLKDAKLLVDQLKINHKKVDLTKTFKTLNKTIQINSQLSINNIKPRLRMTTLYAFAQENNYLVVATSNKDEWNLGYFTKFGDGAGDLAPLIHLTKSEVRNMAKNLNVPQSIIDKEPSAGLYVGQTDEKEMGVSYENIDKWLNNESIDQQSLQIIEKSHKATNHKRESIVKPNETI